MEKLGGMVSRIKENKLHKFISIEHLGEVLMELRIQQAIVLKSGLVL
ncbi:MAG: hypothetical protein MZV64_56880 [Ignavibacteriales bacterium]|nr:hypothetical protein [Ignavibacteriales bacterium]